MNSKIRNITCLLAAVASVMLSSCATTFSERYSSKGGTVERVERREPVMPTLPIQVGLGVRVFPPQGGVCPPQMVGCAPGMMLPMEQGCANRIPYERGPYYGDRRSQGIRPPGYDMPGRIPQQGYGMPYPPRRVKCPPQQRPSRILPNPRIPRRNCPPPNYNNRRRPSSGGGVSWGGGPNARVTIPGNGSGAVYIQ